MAKKIKGFRDLLKQQQTQAASQEKGLDLLEERLQGSGMGGKFEGMVRNPKGEVKMSAVLEAFVEPYLSELKNYQQRLSFLNIAVLAWNLAIIPERQRQPAFEDMLQQTTKSSSPLQGQDGEYLRNLIDELVARKLDLFPKNQRFIVDFQVEDSEGYLHLSVASTLAPFSQNQKKLG